MRQTSILLLFSALGACGGDGTVKDTTMEPNNDDTQEDTSSSDTGAPDTGTNTPTDTATTDTGTTAPYPSPTLLEVSCNDTVNPLRYRCVVEVEPAQPVELTYVRTDGLSVTRAQLSDEELVEHALPVYFLAPDTEYEVTATPTTWPDQSATDTFTTGTPPSSIDSSLDMTGTSTMDLIGSHHPCNTDAVAVIYDTNTGDLVWYQEMDSPGTFGLIDMVQFTRDHTVLGESDGDVVEVDLTGADVVRFNNLDSSLNATGGLWNGLHHDVFKHDDTYYVMFQDTGGGWGFDGLDTLILVDDQGNEITRWLPEEHLPIPANWSGDWLHTNTIYVDEAGDIYLSWLNQSAIGKIVGDPSSPDFGTPIWILTGDDNSGLPSDITVDWSQVGERDGFSFQHSLNLMPDGRVVLLDNDRGRHLIINVDEASGTAVVEGAYDAREDTCGPQGTARATSAGNPVVGCTGDWIREYDAVTEAMIWEAEVQCDQGGGWLSAGASRWYPLDTW